MVKTGAQKARNNARNNKKRKLGLKQPTRNPNPNPDNGRRRHKKPKPQSEDPILFGPNSSDDSDSDAGAGGFSSSPDHDEPSPPVDAQKLLEAYTKEQLVEFLCDGALVDRNLLAKIRSVADRDIAHRKIFVHGLSWDATKEALLELFSPFGKIEDCNVVLDKATGKAKGFGFVLYKTRAGAAKALKQPQKTLTLNNRVIFCQLASVGPTAPVYHHADTSGRKIYISNVHADVVPEKLRAFFSKFGEIESGPMGFDSSTGKSKGYALFVYKTQEGARKALEEPHKMFEGHQLHCQKATEPSKVKEVVPTLGILPVGHTEVGLVGAAPQNVLAAVAAAQNFTLMSQNPSYAALLGQNPLLATAASLNPVGVNSAVFNPAVGAGLGGYAGGSSSVLGAYGVQGGSQYGQSPLGRPGGSYGGMSSYL